MLINEYTKLLSDRLDIASFDDISLNGVQIESENREIKKVAFAVDACFATIDQAVNEGADILVVHHGLFWGKPIAITGGHYKRVKRAIEGNLTLFAAHIPLDAHPVYGNNAQMAIRLGMREFDPFGTWRGKYIGVKGKLPFPMSVEEVAALLDFNPLLSDMLINREEKVESVGIISGGAGEDVVDAIDEGLDLFITGDIGHENYHIAKEAGIDVLGGGHYKSEIFGVKALQRMSEKELGLKTTFIDVETGL